MLALDVIRRASRWVRFGRHRSSGPNRTENPTSALNRSDNALLHIDEPVGPLVVTAFVPFHGWYALDQPPTTVEMSVEGRSVPFDLHARPDVEAVLPGRHINGFGTILDLSRFAIADGRLMLTVTVDGRHSVFRNVEVDPAAIEDARHTRERKASKRAWIESHLQCPECDASALIVGDRGIRCRRCETLYPRTDGAIDMLPAAERQALGNARGAVSMHGYDADALAIIEEVRSRGGMVLDCGAGLRHSVDSNIVTTEVVEYPTTDVLAVSQQLPFRDGVFDAVLSLHVLEHVPDPFRSAAELARVLKPGGRLLCVVPLLAPVHGFPFHFFNMTRAGLARLFEDRLQIEREFVPEMGHPINAMRWIAELYHNHLREPSRTRFRALTIEELLAKGLHEWIGEDVARDLDEYARWTIASNVSALFVKPAV